MGNRLRIMWKQVPSGHFFYFYVVGEKTAAGYDFHTQYLLVSAKVINV